MITLKNWMEAVGYRITEGSEYGWDCFGPNAYRLDSWDGKQDGCSISIVFDTQTQEVFQAEAWDYTKDRAYRWTNPAYVQAHNDETKSRDIDPKEAYEGLNYIDLEVETDFLEKATAIVNEEEYDDRVQVEVVLEDDVMLQCMLEAHKRDITFNQLVEEILIAKIAELKGTEE